jgi:hypothetical protein
MCTLPGQLAAGARAAGLDFIATTEHNTSGAHVKQADGPDPYRTG